MLNDYDNQELSWPGGRCWHRMETEETGAQGEEPNIIRDAQGEEPNIIRDAERVHSHLVAKLIPLPPSMPNAYGCIHVPFAVPGVGRQHPNTNWDVGRWVTSWLASQRMTETPKWRSQEKRGEEEELELEENDQVNDRELEIG